MNKKTAFIILILAVVSCSVFLLWPSDSGGYEEPISEEPQQSDLFSEDEEIQYSINGTYAHYFEDEDKTVFVFFDEAHEMYIQEIMEMESGVSIKTAGKYSLHEDEGIIVIDNNKKELKRDGKNLIIDGILYERTQGILLTLN